MSPDEKDADPGVTNATEHDPLLARPPTQPYGDPDTDDTMARDPNIVLPRRKWIVEPVALLFCVGLLSQSPVVSQFVYYKVGQQYNETGNRSRAFVCDSSSLANSSQHALTNKIQSEASTWTLYRSTVSSVLALIVLPIYASSSDYLGRKPALLLPCIGLILDAVGLLLVVLLDLPLMAIVISGGVGALGGGFGMIFASIFAYLADTTTRKERPIRVAVVEGMFGIAACVIELVMGWWIKLMGYTVPLIFSTSVILANTFYVIFLVPEVRLRKRTSDAAKPDSLLRVALSPYLNIASLFATGTRLAVTLALLLAALGVFSAAFMGSSTISTLYQMNYPFCLDSVFIGYLSSAKIVGYQIGAVFGLLVLRKHLHVRTVSLIVLGLLSSAVGSMLMGLAQSTPMLFVAAGASLFSMLAIPMFRAYTSQIAPAERQGALFSCIGIVEVAGNLAGSAGFTLLYKSTLTWMTGFVYLVMTVITSVAMLLTSACLVMETCCPQRQEKLSEEADSDASSDADLVPGAIDTGIVNN